MKSKVLSSEMEMETQVEIFKFGGAALKDADHVRQAAQIIKNQQKAALIVVVSAMHKTTNALEKLLYSSRNEVQRDALLFQELRDYHQGIFLSLCPNSDLLEWDKLFEDLLIRLNRNDLSYDEHYDLVVAYGEYLSSYYRHKIPATGIDKCAQNRRKRSYCN